MEVLGPSRALSESLVSSFGPYGIASEKPFESANLLTEGFTVSREDSLKVFDVEKILGVECFLF